jgi:hypothetical protein
MPRSNGAFDRASLNQAKKVGVRWADALRGAVPRLRVPSLWRRSSSLISSRTWRVVLEDLALSLTSDRAATTRALPMAALSNRSWPRYSRLKLR